MAAEFDRSLPEYKKGIVTGFKSNRFRIVESGFEERQRTDGTRTTIYDLTPGYVTVDKQVRIMVKQRISQQPVVVYEDTQNGNLTVYGEFTKLGAVSPVGKEINVRTNVSSANVVGAEVQHIHATLDPNSEVVYLPGIEALKIAEEHALDEKVLWIHNKSKFLEPKFPNSGLEPTDPKDN